MAVQYSTEFKVTILGSGTCVPSLVRSSCAVLMTCGSDNLLFDVGSGTIRRLLEAGVSIYDVTHIFLSHFHPDHTGELASFLFSTKYAGGSRGGRPLTLVGGPGLGGFFSKLRSVYGSWVDLADGGVRVVELGGPDGVRYSTGPVTVVAAPTVHREESLAFRVTAASGTSAVYSGDTDYSDSLVALARETDLFICECSHPDEEKTAGHSTPAVAGQMASAAGVKRLVLTHFYPVCEETDIAKQCRRTYNNSLFLAEDLMTFVLNDQEEGVK